MPQAIWIFSREDNAESHTGKGCWKEVDLTEDNASQTTAVFEGWKDANDKWNAMWGRPNRNEPKDGKYYVAGTWTGTRHDGR